MPEDRATSDDTLARATYRPAQGVPSGDRSETAAGPLRVRTVTTSQTKGEVTLRYAPRSPKPFGEADTAS